MQKKRTVQLLIFFSLLVAVSMLALLLQPLIAFGQRPAYSGNNKFEREILRYDCSKKTVFIIADNKVTEMFDMLAPFYLFSQTGKLNVFIVAKEKALVPIRKNLFVLPQLTFQEADSIKLQADVIVIPAISHIDEKQDPVLITFIKNHYTATTKILAVCDGAATAAATGIFDGKLITCHASDFKAIKSHFPNPQWIQQVSVAHSKNLYSTAGVSNAVEGALMVIRDLYGSETMLDAARDIHYPHADLLTTHKSNAVNVSNGFTIAHKILFSKHRKIGMLLQDGINEFAMASILDTYSRTFPTSLTCFTLADSTLRTRFGLKLICIGNRHVPKNLSELHLFSNDHNTLIASQFPSAELIHYDNYQYPIEVCLSRIGKLYGVKFEEVVKLMLDYN